eukprot:3983700-Amphidinium_carterae.1
MVAEPLAYRSSRRSLKRYPTRPPLSGRTIGLSASVLGADTLATRAVSYLLGAVIGFWVLMATLE